VTDRPYSRYRADTDVNQSINLSYLTHPSVIICMLMTITLHYIALHYNQLFISFVTSEFSTTISHLQVDLVSQWMSSNLLSLNQSKMEFLPIGLPAQLPKISDPSLLMPSNAIIAPTSSACNLGVIFDSTLSMSDHISSVLVSYSSVTVAK